MRIRLALLLGAAAAWGIAEAGAGEADIASALSERVQSLFQRCSPAVVRVESADRHGKLLGTGFFVDPLGTVYTVSSAVGDAGEVTLIVEGQRVPARVLTADGRSGIALLRADVSGAFLPVGHSTTLHPASPVMAIGYPLDLQAAPALGLVGGFHRKYEDRFLATTHIWVNMPVERGFGGAPLLDLNGQVVGIVVAGLSGGSACFALPIEAAEKIRRDAARFGRAQPGWVGVTVESEASGQVRIAALRPETPAAQSGLREGDTLLQVGNTPIEKVEDVLDASFFLTGGDLVTIRVRRNGEEIEFPVRAASHPTNSGNHLRAEGIAGRDFPLLEE